MRKERASELHSAEFPKLIRSFWSRAIWMRLGAISGATAFLILLLSDEAALLPVYAEKVRMAAQVQFMHGMATLACATFMNVGAKLARYAPAFFLGGITLFCLPTYAMAIGLLPSAEILKVIGEAIILAGWFVLAWSAQDIDPR